MKLKRKWHWRHKWSNWSDPMFVEFVWPAGSKGYMQNRTCYVCNRRERREV